MSTGTPRRNMLEAVVPYRGYSIPVPGFDPERLARTVDRALEEGVRLSPAGQPGAYRATRPGSTASYTVTRTSCTCRSGSLGRTCKHRALVILLLSILDAPPRAP